MGIDWYFTNFFLFAGQVVQGHDAAGPYGKPADGELRQQARPHPQEREGDRLRQLLLHGGQQPRTEQGIHRCLR